MIWRSIEWEGSDPGGPGAGWQLWGTQWGSLGALWGWEPFYGAPHGSQDPPMGLGTIMGLPQVLLWGWVLFWGCPTPPYGDSVPLWGCPPSPYGAELPDSFFFNEFIHENRANLSRGYKLHVDVSMTSKKANEHGFLAWVCSFVLSWGVGKRGRAVLGSVSSPGGIQTPTSRHRSLHCPKSRAPPSRDEEDPGRSLSAWPLAPPTTLAAQTWRIISSWLSFLSPQVISNLL